MDLLVGVDAKYVAIVFVVVAFIFVFLGMFKMIFLAKKMSKGAFIFLAFFPLISLFPIPGEEVKKLEKIKQVQIKKEDESGDPADDDSKAC
ncbi:hypothetical protein J8L70_02375 [Pseudoalteromonas sp. MMG010]|uniref:hypothetical protein n=1 Tax=Pseudoalteromonas sp. MMG010 TaxID=2822685 RepID=UPI001B3A53C8|nr:hypothetical protein [Pseudoalteromonas sp. MMG010]MBQ4832079.1 hypothetical protein [Pseudoalteromonas sp. MMG010]